MDDKGNFKLCDFGISGQLVDSLAKTVDAGCKPYMAVSFSNMGNKTFETVYSTKVSTEGSIPLLHYSVRLCVFVVEGIKDMLCLSVL